MSSHSKRRRLKNLLKLNPHCFWCDCPVTLENRNNRHTKFPSNGATLDHIISHNDKTYKKGTRNRVVLSCTECNNKRQAKETTRLPIEELWRKSGRYPLYIQEEWARD